MDEKDDTLVKPSASPPQPPPKWKVWAKKPPTTEEAAAGDDDATKPTKDELKPVPYWQLFRYATFDVKLSLFISILNAVGHGTMLPMLTLIFGRIIDQIAFTFLPETNPNFVPLSEIASEIASTTRLFLILSFVAWVVSFFQLFFALRAANTLCNHLRFRFFSALLRQAPPFYDSHSPGSLSQLVISDISLIQAGVGDKLATAIQYITTFLAGLIVGFIKGWQLTLVILAVTPILLGSGFAFGQASSDATGDSLGSYAGANGIASEVLGLIRTVTTFSSQKSESKRYDTALKKAYKGSARASVMSGAGLGVAMFCILSSYGLAFWFGSLKVRSGEMQAGDVLITFFALTLGASSLGTAGPAFKSFSKARAAAPRVYEIIERISGIDPMDHEQGDIIPQDELKGRITFDHVDFNYPNRQFDDSEEAEKEDDLKNATGTNQSELVLNQFQLDIASGTSEALVGKSGCGKSTIARLIQRLYDPLSGCVRLDGVDIRSLNVRWLRSQIGVVAQTPSLFMLSIRDNIALGSGARFDRDATERTTVIEQEVSMEDIVKAAKLANAHDFIMKLPEGYDTMMGERGATLSGGQKQRVCIARALIRNPKILVLDESTASLDTESERIVQEALEKASEGRTTVTIAHRLSTVKNSNNISCIQQGQVVERGPHDALILKQDGYYKGLFELQDIEREKIQQEKEEEHEDAEGDNNALELQAPGTSEGIGKSTTQGPSDSLSKQQQPDGTDESNKKKGADIDKGLFMRTVKLNVGEWPLFLFGSLGSVAAGVVWPLAAIVLVNMIEILSKPEIIMSDVRFWALGFVVLAVGALIGNVLQHASLGVCGERLTLRLRSSVFLKLLQQEMGYFDAHSAGELTTLLANDVGLVKGLTSDLFGVAINVIASLVSGLLIAFLACWKLTLVVLAIIPGVALGGYFEMQASAGFDSGSRSELIKANTVAVESIDNIATVRATGKEQYFHSRFKDVIRSMNGSKLRKDGVTALAFGFSEFCQYLIWYATFKAGGNFMQDGSCSYTEILRSSMGLLFAAITLGNVSVFAPDLGASNLAATQVYRLLDRLSEIHPDGDGNQDDTQLTNVEGDVRASKVYFEYPTRPHTAVLRGLSLHARPGQTIAVVGQSGHGKSTIIALLERFYNVRAGSIKMDDVEISSVSPSTARSHIGLVSQLPELFNRSVFDNIAYGLPEGSAVTQGIVEDAAKQAFAHDFIMQLPQGYHTMVGERGEALSGGQRQRVAIARSLVRQPKVLLLDEATSALDGASERAVQKALDNAGKGRTTIVIAHRLSTIRHADKIVVVRRGKVAEVGTHDELLRKDGVYARLIENQLTEV